MPGDDTINTRGYREAGVDIDAGADLVEAIKPLTRETARPGAEGALGGFAGMFDLAAAGFRDPILVAATDGVGTKLKLAAAAGRHHGVGIDLVAMCVNDLVVAGAEPLFFLDYYATGHLDVAAAKAVIAGVAAGCREAGCALIGGETAEMPGMYGAGEYDLAGFAVGAVERGKALTGATVAPGDVVLGLASSGVHANGFSLVRRVIERAGLHPRDPAPFARERSLADALLVPTRLYVASCLAALRRGGIKALAHITGGGLIENLPRVLPDGVTAEIDTAAWTPPPVFAWLAAAGAIAPGEMMRTFNCGIGMAVIVAPDRVAAIRAVFARSGETVHLIGRIAPRRDGDPAVRLNRLEAAWRG